MEKAIKLLYANIGKLITSSLDFNKVLEGIMEEIRVYFNPEFWSLLRYDQTSEELFFVIFNGPVHLHEVQDIRLKPGEGIAGSVAKKKQPYYVQDTSKEKDFSSKVDALTGFQTKSIIAVPLICRDNVYGVIEIINPVNGSFFSEEELAILQTIADFSAIAFANASMYESAVNFSYTDILTGIFNRAKFELMAEGRKTDEPNIRRNQEKNHISVIAIDLDNFKEINDTYGHPAGDDVLRTAASFFKTCIREDDSLYRIGGDEFIIMLECPSEVILKSAQQRIVDLLNKGNKQKLENDIEFSYSFGYATGNIADLRQVVEMADLQMYSAKKEKMIYDKKHIY